VAVVSSEAGSATELPTEVGENANANPRRKTEDVFVFGVRRKSKQETGIQAIEVARNGRRLKTETSGRAGARLKSDSMRISQVHSEIR